jgi:hypothetical protein
MQTMPMSDRVRAMADPTGGVWAWSPQPEGRRLIEELLILFLERCPDAARFGEGLLNETGTHITDWVGVILTPDTPETRDRLERAGFAPRTTEFVDEDIHYAFQHPVGVFPDILLTDSDRMSVGVRTESVARFFAATQLRGIEHTQGEPLARARWARVFAGDRAAMWVMERHGYDGYHLASEPAEHRIAAAHHLERFRARPRRHVEDGEGIAEALRIVRAAAEEIGPDWAADLFMKSEREFFTRTHCAAGSQHARQANAGPGWANVDHMVYGVGSAMLPMTLDFFGTLGFQGRERFATGSADAALVMEQPITRDVVVLVTPGGEGPGVSGSWAALLGESLLDAGPAGLAIRGDEELLTRQLGLHDAGASKIATRPVPGEHLEALAGQGLIDEALAHSLRNGGRIGTVLRVVSRRDGFRGLTAELLAWRTPGM